MLYFDMWLIILNFFSMKATGKAILRLQLDVYIYYALKYGLISHDTEEYLNLFYKTYRKTDVYELDDSDVDYYMGHVYNEYNSDAMRQKARTSVTRFQRYHMARSKNAPKRGKGKPAYIERIQRAKELAETGKLSLSEIGRAMSRQEADGSLKPLDKSQIHRWLRYPIDKLLKK